MKKTIGLFVLSVIAVGVVAPGFAIAQQNGDQNGKNSIKFEHFLEGRGEFKLDKFPKTLEGSFEVRQPSLTIAPNGKTMIVAGEVIEVNLPNIKVKTWGLTLNVNIPSDVTKLGRLSSDTTGINVAVGDRVDVLGEMNSETGEIKATHFKNRSEARKTIATIQERIKKLLEELDALRRATRQATE